MSSKMQSSCSGKKIAFYKSVDLLKNNADLFLKNCGLLRFDTSSFIFVRHHFFRKKKGFFGASTVIQNDYLMVEYIYYTTSLVSDDVAIQCNRPIKSRHQAKYETIYHTFSSCRRPSQPIG